MNRVICVDTETSGLTDTDEVCELALVVIDVPTRSVISAGAHLVKPAVPIHPRARAAHHITDEELADKFPLPVLVQQRGLPELADPTDFVAAHNAAFDLRMLAQSGLAIRQHTICTWRCALHLFPEADGHSNQALRYSQNIVVPMPRLAAMTPPHRALHDALVTAGIVLKMLETKTPQELSDLTNTPALLSNVAFGQHRGKAWKDMDDGFLRWVLGPGRAFDADTRFTASYHLNQRGTGVQRSIPR